MWKWAGIIAAVFACVGGLVAWNNDQDDPNVVVRGNVLQPGETLEATNKFGHIKISYVSATERKFEWDGISRTVRLIVRPEPFMGQLGLYDPADCFLICLHVPRLLTEESVINFHSYDEIRQFLYQSSAIEDWVYTSDGLVADFGGAPERMAVYIDLFQILLNGKKPENLAKARNNLIRLVHK